MRREKIGGFQPDGTYVQKISRQTLGPAGEKGWYSPQRGESIVTPKGPFTVGEILEIFQLPDGRRYFRARGHLRQSFNYKLISKFLIPFQKSLFLLN